MNVNTSNNVITGNNLGTPYFTANVIKFLNANCIIRLFRALNAKTYYSICKRLFFFQKFILASGTTNEIVSVLLRSNFDQSKLKTLLFWNT